ncbi:MAG TPA: polysaccharide deacetylase family protein [Polyangiaceae bacterium]|nr:polysaccharide deacetylase family protein [Polyangiaceae bacterium]
MKASFPTLVLLGAASLIACSPAEEGGNGFGGKVGKGGAKGSGGTNAGGSVSGGASSGGAAFGGTTSGGTSSGGASAGGTNSGGQSPGGTANGGSSSAASGGVTALSGGAANAGSANGGAANGGTASGGSANGGTAQGGTSSGGAASGGTANGGMSNGGTAQGGASSGGAMQGGTANGGASGKGGSGSGGAGSGGAASGGSAGNTAKGGTTGTGGTTSSGGTGGTSTIGPSDLPVPAGPSNVPKPTQAAGGFKILDWAGFKGAISFTFDDALGSQLAHYAEFKATGVRMTFYLVCNNDMSNTAWKTIAQDGQELGNHTNHHCNANGSGCGWGSFTGTSSEFDDCTAHLKSAFGLKDVYTSASPMGDVGWDTPASTRFLANRGVQDTGGVAPNDNTNPYELPCHVADANEKAASGTRSFNGVTDNARANNRWRIILNHSVGNNDGYNPVAASEVVAAMTYAKGRGDVWVDTVANVAAYWRAQKLVSSATPQTAGTSTTWSWTLPAHFPPGRYLRVTVNGGTLSQKGAPLTWDGHGYYEVSLDAGSVTLSP